MLEISINNTQLQLLKEKAIYWPEQSTLILADLHLGKITHFRKAGIGLPPEVENDNFERLSQLIFNFQPRVVLILGDLFHSHHNHQWERFREFCGYFKACQFVLVMGNHDILAPMAYQIDRLTCHSETYLLAPFIFSHHPLKQQGAYNMCGHIHPSIRLAGRGLQSIKLPCFHFTEQGVTLPAFGSFTGTAVIKPSKKDEVYAITEERVIKVL